MTEATVILIETIQPTEYQDWLGNLSEEDAEYVLLH
jgi:hypothetical protein